MDNFKAVLVLKLKDLEALVAKGRAILQSGDVYDSAWDFNKVIKINPDYPGIYLYRGNTRALRHPAKGALEDFAEALRRDPGNADIYNGRGIAYSQKGN